MTVIQTLWYTHITRHRGDWSHANMRVGNGLINVQGFRVVFVSIPRTRLAGHSTSICFVLSLSCLSVYMQLYGERGISG